MQAEEEAAQKRMRAEEVALQKRRREEAQVARRQADEAQRVRKAEEDKAERARRAEETRAKQREALQRLEEGRKLPAATLDSDWVLFKTSAPSPQNAPVSPTSPPPASPGDGECTFLGNCQCRRCLD